MKWPAPSSTRSSILTPQLETVLEAQRKRRRTVKHIGIDLGSRNSHICIRDEKSHIVEERVVKTEDLGGWFAEQPPSFVVLETCTETFAVADLAQASGHTLRVVPATVVKQLGVGYRGVKNDVRDAQVLSRASVALGEELPTVHVPSACSRKVKQLLSQRETLVHSRTAMVNMVKGQLRGQLLRLGSGNVQTVAKRTRALLKEGAPELLTMLEPVLQSLEALDASVRLLDKQIAGQSAQEPRVALLRSAPGVGLLTASCFVATLDSAERFDSVAKISSYLGLTPRENTTGGNRKLLGITKAGKAQMRTLLIQASWTLVRTAPDTPLAKHFAKLIERRPKQVAITAIARRLAGLLYAMMRDGTFFDTKQTRSRQQQESPSPLAA